MKFFFFYFYNVVVVFVVVVGGFILLYLNEYHLPQAIYTLHGETRNMWIDGITKAQVSKYIRLLHTTDT